MKKQNVTEQHTTRGIRRIACVITLGMAFTFALPAAAHAQSGAPPPVPDSLQVPAPSQGFLVGHGVGTQNYVCVPSPSIGRVDWALFTPQATLFNDQAEQLTTHFFSPNPVERGTVRVTWEDSRDTSTVWARVIASSVDPHFVKAGAIPWLLLQVVGAQDGPMGGDTLSGTSFIQRLTTDGGSAPSTGCNLPTDIGNKAFVPYTADYFFYKN
jgi:hypothetical protein